MPPPAPVEIKQTAPLTLVQQLQAVAKGDAHADGQAVRAELTRHLAEGRKAIRERFDAGERGMSVARATARLTDDIVRALFLFTTERVYPAANPTRAERLSLVAVGGYGRGEMAPHSDVDLLFLLPFKQTAWGEQVVEYLLYVLWDLGLKVGHASRSVDECVRLPRNDITIRTSILETRLLCGDGALYDELRRRFAAEIIANTGPAYVEAKLAERDERHRKLGDSRYLVEPNVKDGKGGLRDLHTLFWIAKYLYQVHDRAELVPLGVFTERELLRFVKSEEFLWSVRFALHYLTGRAEERITFDVQGELAQRLGYKQRTGARSVERFMKHYYLYAKEVGDLTRIFCAVLEERHKRRPRFRLPLVGRDRPEMVDGFVLSGGRVDVGEPGMFARDPVMMLRLFHLAQERELDIHPHALRAVTQSSRHVNADLRADRRAAKLFLEMLTSKKDPETTLRRLNEAGVFGRFIPDFGRVVAQMQHDMYHVYTVDEHTIRAIGMLGKLESGKLREENPLATEVIDKVLSRRVLFVAVLLHDIAKGRGGDHSVLGAEVANRVGPMLGLEEQETETVAWLVLHHLDMSKTAFRRDVHDPKTIADFAALVQSPERLRLLLVLTVSDIRAVGPGRWNGWSGQLLRELYFATEAALAGGESVVGASKRRIEEARAACIAALADWPAAERDAHMERFYPAYWNSFDLEIQLRHARFLRGAGREAHSLAIGVEPLPQQGVSEVTVYAQDYAGLFAGAAGAMALAGANIVNARVVTLNDGMALESFWVQGPDGGPLQRPEDVTHLKKTLTEVLTGKLSPAKILRQRKDLGRTRVFTVQPRVLVDNAASDKFTVIEVNARDRRGLLFTITQALLDFGLSISSARIATYGERAVDVFYVRDLIGHKITAEPRIARLREKLLAALADEPAPAPVVPAHAPAAE
ncbi:MAG: [protein-PII] uridylyltransferase [Alphaproteobacteria bacterium]|nr:[protein-PII] uridylyltransferase [Alphaproteobacteria bacterium]